MIYFIDVINIIIVSIMIKKKSLIRFKKFNKKDQIAYFFKISNKFKLKKSGRSN